MSPDEQRAAMQATVLTFDADTGAGTLVTDEGRVVAFDPAAFAAGGLRLLRRGQRVRASLSPAGAVVAVTIYTLPDLSPYDEEAGPPRPTPPAQRSG